MTTDGIPPMEPLAPIVDQLRALARVHLPSPRTCRVRLWEDGTFDASVYHSRGEDLSERISYVRTTGEIIWESGRGGGWESHGFADGETLHVPTVEESNVRVLARVDPPYRSWVS
jgi:hypothetical protein